MQMPATQYAMRDGVHIAYHVVGDGPRDLVFVWGPFSHLEVAWENPGIVRMVTQLASFSRVIHLDKRGTGLSDRGDRVATFEEQIDDVLAVLDAAGSERAVIFGGSYGSLLAILFAAAHPDRTEALVVASGQARMFRDDDYPWGPTAADWEDFLVVTSDAWGTGVCQISTPSHTDEATVRWWAKMERFGLNRGNVMDLWRMIGHTDVRPVLPAIHVPTLVIHRHDDPLVEVEKGRYIAEHIDGARFVELEGRDHPGWAADIEAETDEIEMFLTGARPSHATDRVLATVLFTDIVGSTEQAATLGDRRWRQVLDSHDDVVVRQLAQHRGRLVKTTGDGAVAVFDGPVRAIQCAQAIRDNLRMLGIDTRMGLHTGEVETRGDDIGGIAVHLAQRIEALAGAGELLVSRTVKDLVVGSGIGFLDRGVHALKGIPDPWQVLAVAS